MYGSRLAAAGLTSAWLCLDKRIGFTGAESALLVSHLHPQSRPNDKLAEVHKQEFEFVGRPWQSILVQTGVFRGGPGSNSKEHPADLVVRDVEEAVAAALSGRA